MISEFRKCIHACKLLSTRKRIKRRGKRIRRERERSRKKRKNKIERRRRKKEKMKRVKKMERRRRRE